MIDRLYVQDAGAVITPCQRYRYLLWRRWDSERGICAFVALNPSTADASNDDPTVRRMRGFARDWGYGELWVLNAYAWRATDPRELYANRSNAVGPLNNEYLSTASAHAEMMVAAWGNLCDDLRERAVRNIVTVTGRQLHHLGLTQAGHPKHPLYLSADTEPVPWS